MNHSQDRRIERERLYKAVYYTVLYKYKSINITVAAPLEIRGAESEGPVSLWASRCGRLSDRRRTAEERSPTLENRKGKGTLVGSAAVKCRDVVRARLAKNKGVPPVRSPG